MSAVGKTLRASETHLSSLKATERVRGKRPAGSVDLETILARLPEVTATIAKDAARRERERELPYEAFALIRSACIGALRVPASLGGPGASISCLIEVVAQLAAADSNVAHALRSHFNFVETMLLASSQRRAIHIERILEDSIYGGAHTELGTPRPGEVRTLLTKHEDGYRLNGRKFYSTGALFADVLFITASDETGRSASVEVERGRSGLQVLDDWDGMGQRLTASGTIVIDNAAIRPEEIEWRDTAERQDAAGRHAATFRQLYLAACVAGIVRNVLSDAVSFVQTKARPITHGHADRAADDMLVQRTVGLISARSFAIGALIADAAERIDLAHEAVLKKAPEADGLLTESALATAKAQSVIADLAQAAATGIFDTGGGSATSRSLNFDRHWRNIRTLLAHNPIDYKLKVIGEHALSGRGPPLSGGFF
jgi:alkylation response protein AidB-like acyl-CoA dehydrogenase